MTSPRSSHAPSPRVTPLPRAMERADEVTECHNVAGAFEYMLRVEVSDLAAYKTFHPDKLGTAPHVRTITSYMVMGTPKDLRG